MSLKERAKKLKTDIPAVFLALKHKDTPLKTNFFSSRLRGLCHHFELRA